MILLLLPIISVVRYLFISVKVLVHSLWMLLILVLTFYESSAYVFYLRQDHRIELCLAEKIAVFELDEDQSDWNKIFILMPVSWSRTQMNK